MINKQFSLFFTKRITNGITNGINNFNRYKITDKINTINFINKRFISTSNICYYSDKYTNKNKFNKSVKFEPCIYCDAKGLVICNVCNGSGKVYFDGFKETICERCSRFGCILCNMCHGTCKDNNLF